MSLEILSKFLVVSVTGGGLIAVPAATLSSWGGGSSSVNLFVESLSKDQNILKNVSKEDLKKSDCKVLVTDVENNKSQIIVCPSGSSVTFLYAKDDSGEVERIKSFSNTVSNGTYRGGKWEDDYQLQFQLAETRSSRVSSSTKIKISKTENGTFSKLKDYSLSSCNLVEEVERSKLLCTKNQSSIEISISSSTTKDFSMK